MSFDSLHNALASDARTRHILSMQGHLLQAIRQTLAVSGSPNAEKIYRDLWHNVNESIGMAHADYILGRGPVANTVFQTLRITQPDLSTESILEDHIRPQLPQYMEREGSENADRSVNRHWATMIRVAFGANEQGQWNRAGLESLRAQGLVTEFNDFIQDQSRMAQAGATLLRLQQAEDEYIYLVRVATETFNRNTMTIVDGRSHIEASVFVPLEGIWAVHEDGGLIDDVEVENYVTALLRELGLHETPMDIQPSEAESVMEEVSAEEIAELTQDVPESKPAEEPSQSVTEQLNELREAIAPIMAEEKLELQGEDGGDSIIVPATDGSIDDPVTVDVDQVVADRNRSE